MGIVCARQYLSAVRIGTTRTGGAQKGSSDLLIFFFQLNLQLLKWNTVDFIFENFSTANVWASVIRPTAVDNL